MGEFAIIEHQCVFIVEDAWGQSHHETECRSCAEAVRDRLNARYRLQQRLKEAREAKRLRKVN